MNVVKLIFQMIIVVPPVTMIMFLLFLLKIIQNILKGTIKTMSSKKDFYSLLIMSLTFFYLLVFVDYGYVLGYFYTILIEIFNLFIKEEEN